jgi:hypothetical protein
MRSRRQNGVDPGTAILIVGGVGFVLAYLAYQSAVATAQAALTGAVAALPGTSLFGGTPAS